MKKLFVGLFALALVFSFSTGAFAEVGATSCADRDHCPNPYN